MRVRIVLSTVVAAAAVLTIPGPTAFAEDRAPSALTLKITTKRGERTVLLRCSPPGGTHPHPVRACADIRKAGGVENLPTRPRSGVCPDFYQGITASATGIWDGQQVNWKHEYPNSCYMAGSTGAVFEF